MSVNHWSWFTITNITQSRCILTKLAGFPSSYQCRVYGGSGIDLVKYGGQGQLGQAIKLFQIMPYVSDFQTLNNPGS